MVVHPAQAKAQILIAPSGPPRSLAWKRSPIRFGDRRICKHFPRGCHEARAAAAPAPRRDWATGRAKARALIESTVFPMVRFGL
jgi:hypothetical protein